MSSSHLVTAIPVLPVQDLAKSLEFYRDRLGFRVAFEFGPYAGVEREGIEIHLSVEDSPPGTCRVAVRGVDDLYEQMQQQQVIHPDEPLATQAWGMRQFSVLDPTGNRITFAQQAPSGNPSKPATKQFVVTFTHVEGAWESLSKDDIPKMIEGHAAWQREVQAHRRSSLVFFADAAQAKTIQRSASGEIATLDGPFTQGPESAGGFYIIEAESMDAAVEIAKQHRWLPGSNEVRELAEPPGMAWWIRAQ